MSLNENLNNVVGLPIERICKNKFHNHNENHCAHFVSHLIEFENSYNCKDYKGGSNKAANIRVHEVFANCPLVGKIEDAPNIVDFLVFVTDEKNVDISTKTMTNVPKKHIGIFSEGFVYHYSNTEEKVCKWTIEKFLSTFQKTYKGNQKLFFGLIPGSDLELKVDSDGFKNKKQFTFKLEKDANNNWSATCINDDTTFYVGKEIMDDKNKYYGLYMPTNKYYGKKFNAQEYFAKIDHWAYLLYATAYCESNHYFNLHNTYDRAKFTFGFYQFAAHTPNDNLILFFKEIAKLDNFKNYFPELSILNGKLTRINENGSTTDLEVEMNTGPNGSAQLQLFMNFLNPNRTILDEQEILHAARLLHWTANDQLFRDKQVEVANTILQNKFTERYTKWYNLDGKSDTICAIIADIHHHGRAKKVEVQTALSSSNSESKLLNINNDKHKDRNDNLKSIIATLKSNGKLGSKKYHAATNEFI